MAHEEWRDVVGYEGYYQVSNLGRIRSLDRAVRHAYRGTQSIKGHILTPCRGNGPYYSVMLSKDGKAKSLRVHRLVATAFVPNPDRLNCVNHKDGDKLNNSASNLEWCTHRHNTQHAIDHKLLTYDNSGFSTWSEESRKHYSRVRKRAIIRSDGKRYESTADAAKDLGVTYSAVMHVLRGLNETCRGFKFSYA